MIVPRLGDVLFHCHFQGTYNAGWCSLVSQDEYVRTVVAEQGEQRGEAMRYLRRKMEGKPRQICLLNTKGGEATGRIGPVKGEKQKQTETEGE